MSCCCVLPFFILSLSKYNQFSQSKNCRFMVRWRGTDGKALLQPLAFAGRLCGLQMCLGVKGWVRGLVLTYLFFNHYMLKLVQNYLESNRSHLGNVQCHFGSVRNYLGNIQCHFGSVQSHLGIIQCHLGSVRSHLGIVQCHFGNIRSHFGNNQ